MDTDEPGAGFADPSSRAPSKQNRGKISNCQTVGAGRAQSALLLLESKASRRLDWSVVSSLDPRLRARYGFRCWQRSERHPPPHPLDRLDLPGQLLRRIDRSRVNAGVSGQLAHHLDRHAIDQGLPHKGMAHPVRAGFLKPARIKTGIGRTFGHLGEEAFEHRIDASGALLHGSR